MGRKGDPRMHRSVAARLVDPDMSLLDALRQGGFNFPAEGGHDITLHDADGVTLGQRKNQLSRRLRLAHKALEEGRPTNVSVAADPQAETNKRLNKASDANQARKRGLKREDSAVTSDNDDDVDMSDDMANMDRMAKYHPQFHALFPAARPSTNLSSNPTSTQTDQGLGSGVAVASLISTSSAVGMTLEQLAMSLSNTPTLFHALSSNPDPEDKLKLAVNLYKNDARALMQKSMLLAGYESSETIEGQARYMQVALKVWEVEGKRLESLLGCANETQGGFCECLPGVGSHGTTVSPMAAVAAAAAVPTEQQFMPQQSSCCGSHAASSQDEDAKPAAFEQNAGRHVHRLSGKCGHKAIIHQPTGRPAHIDFVVDGKIECYEGIKPVGPKGQGALWPSRYNCIDLACPTDSLKQNVACGSNVCCDDQVSDKVHNAHPKQLSLTDVDFDGKEWNVDFFAHDGQDDTLLGLIKLGDGDKKKDFCV